MTKYNFTGQPTRRGFIGGAAALGAGIAASGSFGMKSARAAGGAHMKVGCDGASATDSLNPITYLSSIHACQGYTYGNTLTEIGEGGKVIPELAESWDASADARVWKFNLRRGVTFHNGKEMTAADVVWSLNLHRGEDSKSGAAGIMKDVKDVRADGKHAVIVEMTSGNADVPYLVADYHLLVLPENTTDFEKGVGTGAYIIEDFQPGVRLLARKNENYFKDRALNGSVEILSINDGAARTSALQTGEVHVMNRVDLKTLSLLKRNKNVEILSASANGHYTFPMMADRAPYNNSDLRLALKLAMDRDELLKKVLRGYGKVGNDHPISQADAFHADLPQRAYDPEKAAHHFKKSGFDGPIQLSTSEGAWPGAVDAATLYQEQAARAGISIEIKREPSDGYWSNVWMAKPFCMSYWGGRPTPDLMFSVAYKSDAAWNEGFYKSDQFDELLIQARAELDFDKRKALYHDMQLMLHNDGGSIIPLFNDFVDAAHKDVKGFIPGNFELSGYRVAERMYLEG